MALESLLGKLEDAAGRIRVLEREKNEAMVRIQALEREANELRSIISLAESKADEMLRGSNVPDASRVPAAPKAPVASAPPASKGLQDLMEPSAAQQEELRRRFPHAFSST
jgi:uncharacterized protein YcsI (UPF0317 family)